MIRKILAFAKHAWTKREDEGQALIELSLALPLLCVMLLGMAELARVAYAAIEVSNAAHAAAQYAASSRASASNYAASGGNYSGGISNAANADSDLSGSDAIKVTAVSVSCTCANTAYTPSSCSDNTTCISNNTGMIETVTVQTQTSFHPLIKIPYFTDVTQSDGSIKLYGYSSQVVTNQ